MRKEVCANMVYAKRVYVSRVGGTTAGPRISTAPYERPETVRKGVCNFQQFARTPVFVFCTFIPYSGICWRSDCRKVRRTVWSFTYCFVSQNGPGNKEIQRFKEKAFSL